jgi:diacylglycerol kinase family enzyme
MRVALIVNRKAKRARDPSLLPRLEQAAQQAGVQLTALPTQSLDELAPTLSQARGCDLLALCGGDGSLAAMLTAAVPMFPSLPPLILLPGGTMNTVARNLGLRGSYGSLGSQGSIVSLWRRALRVLTQAGDPARLPLLPVDVLRATIRDERPLRDSEPDLAAPPTERTRLGFIFGAAMGARYLAAYTRHPGPAWAIWLALRTVGSSLIPGGGPFARWLFSPTRAALNLDGQDLPEESFRMVLCATVPDVGLGFRVPWQAGRTPGRFHLVASGIPITENALQVPRILRGQPLSGSPHVDRLAGAARIRFASPQQLTLDGEVFSGSDIELSLGPALRVLLPG